MADAPVHRGSVDFNPVPARAGIGLKAQHYREILETGPDLGWFEVHPENYMGPGGPPHHYLTRIRERYPLSLHGVGLSLGSAAPVDEDHLKRLAALADRYQPGLVSEHLSWSVHEGAYFNDLLPLPLTHETLDHVAKQVDRMQMALGRQVLIENPSTYVRFKDAEMSEPEFLAALARKAGCGLLLDINNAYVSASNHGFDPAAYLDAIPFDLVGEIHLAGHAVESVNGVELRIDDHGSTVCDPVWELYRAYVGRSGPIPTLIEWDTRVPALAVLIGEAGRAQKILDAAAARPAELMPNVALA